MDNSKVKVNKELYNCLEFIKDLHGESVLKTLLKEKTNGYIYKYKEYLPLNKIDLQTFSKIYFNGYELEEKYLPEENKILNNVHHLLHSQTAKGIEKYGKTVNANDYTTEQWIDHASEEIIDMLVYLQCLKQSIKESMNDECRDNS